MTATNVLLAVYAALIVGAGVLVARRVRASGDFFVASRSLPAPVVFATMLAANIGAGSTVGATGLAYRYGLSAWWWSGSAAIGCLVLGLVVAPRMHRLASEHGFFTVGDFLEWRFDRSVRVLIAAVLGLGTLSLLAGQLLAMAWAFEVIAGLPRAAGAALAALVLVLYFSGGGLLASAWVNLVQLVTLLAGFALAARYAWRAAGGWEGMRAAAGGDPSFGTFTGMGTAGILGLAVVFVPSFFVSPGLLQKTFGARSSRGARWASLGNAVALAAFAFLPALFGMAMRAVEPGLSNPELALPRLTTDVLPPWLGGLALAALFAAEVSTADAVLFMLSTSLSRDLFQAVLRPEAKDAELLRAGRLAAAGGGVLGVLLALVLPSVATALKLFYGVMTAALLTPLLVGLLSRRPGAAHARAAIVVSIVATGTLSAARLGTAEGAWLPSVTGVALASLVFATAWLRPRRSAS
ncbi:MAG TPA: sodium:solute symporter family protein [Vicinamibacteria bacterium]|nr:sodium:solute symporter family protein [Vicinamibacteria bacterium]